MQPTDIRDPEYFHKVVDCQWACPAHTPVPEYIRLIAAQRYADAYMINWQSNVFPGILGRTCDRPCEPACRRGRVEDAPVAICRLKRVAADYKGDIRARLPLPAAQHNGKTIALVGAGPASLTVARDLAPLGYRCVVFDGDSRGGGMIRSQIPHFRLPESVIDEEVGYIVDLGIEMRLGQRIDSLKSLLADGFDAVFIGSGAPRGRDLPLPGRQEAGENIHIGIDWLSSVSFGHIEKIGKRVIVLGGGNTAMDCCRSARRLGGEDVKVIVRSGFEEMKASPWEKEDAMGEDIPILNWMVPKEFTHADGRLTGVVFETVKAERDANGRRRLVPTGEPDQHIPCDDVLVAVGQENAFPWIERDIGAGVRSNGTCRWSIEITMRIDPSARVLRRRRRVRPEEHHLGGGARPPGRDLHPQALPRARICAIARRPWSPWRRRRWASTSGATTTTSRSIAASRCRTRERRWRCRHQRRGRTRLRRPAGLRGGGTLPELRRADGVHRQALHRMRRLRRYLPGRLHHLHRQRGRGRPAQPAEGAGART